MGQAATVDAVVDALRSMALPSGLTACALIMGFDDATEQVVAHVALVLTLTPGVPQPLRPVKSLAQQHGHR